MKKPGVLLSLCFLLVLLATPVQAQSFRPTTDPAPTSDQALSGFGGAVAIGDDEIFVAEPNNAYTSGMVFIYRRDQDGRWAEHQRLSASDATRDNRFGRAMALEGNTLLIGATRQADITGAAYVFFKDEATDTWVETVSLTASDGLPQDAFGRAIALQNGVALISAAGRSNSTGAVYVFRSDPATGAWTQQALLEASDGEGGDSFGLSLSFAGDRALIGAPRKNDDAGRAYVFRYEASSETWLEETTLEARGLTANSQFGSSVHLHGNTAYVGAPLMNRFSGSAFLFEYDAEQQRWAERNALLPFDASPGLQFGASVLIHRNEAWIGAAGGFRSTGAIYRVSQDEDEAWTGVTKLTSKRPSTGFAQAVAVKRDLAVVGATGTDHGAGSAIVFRHGTETGQWTEETTLVSKATGLEAIVDGQVDCADGAASVFGCEDVDLVSFLPVHEIGGKRGIQTNDIWGWTDPQTNKEYALVGMLDGTSFVDISNPYNPRHLGFLPKTEGSPSSIWRDVKVYKDHAFIVSDGAGNHGMQVFDLTQLRDVADAPVTFSVTAHYDQIHSAHNIVINEETGFAYSVGSSSGGETCGGGLHMINVQDPINPTFAGCFADPTTGRASTGYTHDAQCITYNGPDTEHRGKEICLGANETALSIADVTDKDNPVPLSTGSYPNVGYSHQGWISDDHRYFYMNDELDEIQRKVEGTRTLIWDLADLDDPIFLKEHVSENPATDHNLYIQGQYMYQSNYQSGLRILDISDPGNPVEVGHFDTVPFGEDRAGMGGSWSNYPFFKSGVIVVTSGNEGLFVLKKKDVDL